MHRELRATGDRVVRLDAKPWSSFNDVEDWNIEARAWENTMGIIARHGGAVSLGPARDSTQLLDLFEQITQAWHDPFQQGALFSELLSLLVPMSAVLSKDNGLWAGSTLGNDLITIGLCLAPIAAQLSSANLFALIMCIDYIFGKDNMVLGRMLNAVSGYDKVYLFNHCNGLAAPKRLGGTGDILALRIVSYLNNEELYTQARILGH